VALVKDLPEIVRTIFVTGFWHVIGFDECVLKNKNYSHFIIKGG
jgi:hypothetical protein